MSLLLLLKNSTPVTTQKSASDSGTGDGVRATEAYTVVGAKVDAGSPLDGTNGTGVQAGDTIFTNSNGSNDGSMTWSNVQSISNSSAIRILNNSIGANNLYYSLPNQGLIFRRVYIYVAAQTSQTVLWSVRQGATSKSDIYLDAGGHFVLRGPGTWQTSTTTALGKWVRVEWRN